MDYTIIDAHAHLWLRQDTVVDDLPIRTLDNGRSLFMGEIRQMVPPFMVDGVNSAEVFLSNMDYAQVSAAVITQEFIDGIQNEYLAEVISLYPDRFFVCGMCEFRKPGFLAQAKELIARGFKAIKIPAQRLLLTEGRVMLNCEEMMQMFGLMEERNIILSIDLAEGSTQIAEMEEIIAQYPRLKIAIGHFGMVTLPEWKQQILLRHISAVIFLRFDRFPIHPDHTGSRGKKLIYQPEDRTFSTAGSADDGHKLPILDFKRQMVNDRKILYRILETHVVKCKHIYRLISHAISQNAAS